MFSAGCLASFGRLRRLLAYAHFVPDVGQETIRQDF
jgi:hypothetical protein